MLRSSAWVCWWGNSWAKDNIQMYSEDKYSAVYSVIHGQANYGFLAFHPKKIDAYKQQKYTQSAYEYNLNGSIICKYFAVAGDDNKVYIKAILSLSTTDEPLIDDADEDKLKSMTRILRNVILDNYERKLSYELALFFMEKTRKQPPKCFSCGEDGVNAKLIESRGMYMHQDCLKQMWQESKMINTTQ